MLANRVVWLADRAMAFLSLCSAVALIWSLLIGQGWLGALQGVIWLCALAIWSEWRQG